MLVVQVYTLLEWEVKSCPKSARDYRIKLQADSFIQIKNRIDSEAFALGQPPYKTGDHYSPLYTMTSDLLFPMPSYVPEKQ